MGKKKRKDTLSFGRLVDAIDRFAVELGLDERNYEFFCTGLLILLRKLPVNQFEHERDKNVIPFQREK
jgi:hypothetical protein